jgi:uncharacterized phage protein (TIGR02216 family)
MTERTPWMTLYAQSQSLKATSAHEFWRLSLKEWRALTAPAGAGVLDRAAFDALAAQLPDERVK